MFYFCQNGENRPQGTRSASNQHEQWTTLEWERVVSAETRIQLLLTACTEKRSFRSLFFVLGDDDDPESTNMKNLRIGVIVGVTAGLFY